MYSEHDNATGTAHPIPWHKDRLIGPKPPLKLRDIWAIQLQMAKSGL